MHNANGEEHPVAVRVEVVAGNVIEKDGKYLLVQEKLKHVCGLWNFPAGRVDTGESIEDAAIREAKEETGFDVEIVERLAIYHESAQKAVKHIFLSVIVGGKLSVQTDELLDAKWFTAEEVDELKEAGKLRAPWKADVIRLAAQRREDQ